jgi:mycofactocin system glycosyltransferase
LASIADHPEADPEADSASITVVIPSFTVEPEQLPLHAPTRYRCIVVDDGSPTPLPARDGFVTILLDRNRGPAAARNAGLALVDSPLVAFVDSDVSIDDNELRRLAAHFSDATVALVAPRIRVTQATNDSPIVVDHGPLHRYELHHSPLDMGPFPARIAAATRVSYVPAAVVLCRTEAVRAIAGFDEAMRFGEDVDLVWRLAAAGWTCRYEPAVEARHQPRATLRGWIAQRFHYGTSAAPLDRRHPGAVAPLRMNGWSAAAWVPVLAGFPLIGVAIGALSSVLLVRKLPYVAARESLRLAALGNVFAGRLIASAITRTWWPLAVVAAIVSKRARRVLLAAIIVPAILDRREHPTSLDPVSATALRVLDDAAYGAGVWAGAWRERNIGALLPTFTPWPPRRTMK